MNFSIITATYNSAESLDSCIVSVNDQNYPFVDHVFIDGASRDCTLKRIQNLTSRLAEIISEKDKGIYDALNKGITLSKGEIIGFVHSDDFLASPTILSDIARLFKEENVDGVYGDLVYVNKEDTSKVIRYWKSQQFYLGLLNQGWMPAHPTLFIKKEVYEKHGLFNLNFKIAADYDFMLRIFQDESLKFKYLPKVVTIMRIGGASNKSLKNIWLKSSEDLKALKANRIKLPYLALAKKNLSKIEQFLFKNNF